jgi:hypothetical protein
MSDTPFRSRTEKTMITLVIDLTLCSTDELSRLLLSLERATKAVSFWSQTGNQLVWQCVVESFDPEFWKKVAEGNQFQLYTHSLNHHW